VPSRYRVVLGWAAGLLVFLLARPSSRSMLLALGPVALGEAIRLWASGHIEKTQRLATGGPYAFTRNPLYLGSALIALGVALAGSSVLASLVIAGYVAAFYPSVMKEESAFLRAKFTGEYEAWAAEVPAFLPRLSPGGPRETRFSWERVARNREWRTVLALPLAAGLLLARRLLPLWCGIAP
jgi:protein-S-isoprenylcysteine O-methyltransferase Ste14